MDANIIAWLVLRIVYAWMFLYPIVGLLKNWLVTIKTTELLFPRYSVFFAVVSLLVMFFGGLTILFGAYARVGALFLIFFNLGGMIIHYRLGKQAASLVDDNDGEKIIHLSQLAQVGHVTSAQKNLVLAAVAFFIMLQGSGPLSMV